MYKKNFLVFPMLAGALLLSSLLYGYEASQIIVSYAHGSLTEAFHEFSAVWVGDWKGLGQQFTIMQSGLFSKLFLGTVVVIPVIFLLHYIVFGPRKFQHPEPGNTGDWIKFYGAFTRVVHWFAAICMTILAITGLMIIFGKYIGGGPLVRTARLVHSPAAAGFTISAIILFLVWIREMLPAPCDFKWLLMAGGYLSRTPKPVPAGKFNAGQKMWFWLATAGGMVMAWTGYFLFNHQAPVYDLRLFAIIHNLLGVAILALFLVHLYMSLFAVKGSLKSMLSGYKSRQEVEMMHSLYRP